MRYIRENIEREWKRALSLVKTLWTMCGMRSPPVFLESKLYLNKKDGQTLITAACSLRILLDIFKTYWESALYYRKEK